MYNMCILMKEDFINNVTPFLSLTNLYSATGEKAWETHHKTFFKNLFCVYWMKSTLSHKVTLFTNVPGANKELPFNAVEI